MLNFNLLWANRSLHLLQKRGIFPSLLFLFWILTHVFGGSCCPALSYLVVSWPVACCLGVCWPVLSYRGVSCLVLLLVLSYLPLSCLLGTINALPSKPGTTLSLPQIAARLVSCRLLSCLILFLFSCLVFSCLVVVLSCLGVLCLVFSYLVYSYLLLSCFLGTSHQRSTVQGSPNPQPSTHSNQARIFPCLVLSHLVVVLFCCCQAFSCCCLLLPFCCLVLSCCCLVFSCCCLVLWCRVLLCLVLSCLVLSFLILSL